MSCKLEPAIWSRGNLDLTGVNWSCRGCPMSKKYTVNQGCMSRRRRRRRAYAPMSNTANHDNHEKINSCLVSFPR